MSQAATLVWIFGECREKSIPYCWIESSLMISPKEQVEVMERIFAKGTKGNMYFCVHLGRTDGMDVSSSLAKEIAIKIVSDYYKQ